ncbi:MAG: hypothetical protein Q7U04_04890 [Bacteriovorax sp.]|nr:hypothetical protein [Bacteriovorax sp.]
MRVSFFIAICILCSLNAFGVEVSYEDLRPLEVRIIKDGETMDKVTAKQLSKQYIQIAEDIDRKLTNVEIYNLEKLMEKRNETVNEKALKEIDGEIKKSNERLSQFKDKNNFLHQHMYKLMHKFNFEGVTTIEELRVKSLHYSQVNADKNGISIYTAGQRHSEDLPVIIIMEERDYECHLLPKENIDECVEQENKKLEKLKFKSRLSAKGSNTNSECETVSEQYVICNGNKYIRDLKDNQNLNRVVKQIEEHIDSSASKSNEGVSK